jgi:peptide/nickel transport system ATP-binding protein
VTALLSIRDLTVTYRRDGSEVAALRSVSFDLAAGERLAVIGESGSGKSTLALAIAGLLPASSAISGKIDWLGPVPHRLSQHSVTPSVLPDISLAGDCASSSLSPITEICMTGAKSETANPLEGDVRQDRGGDRTPTSLPRQVPCRRDIGFVSGTCRPASIR